MTDELREILERFDYLPDDAVVPSKITAIILGTSDTIRNCGGCRCRWDVTVSALATSASFAAKECHRFLAIRAESPEFITARPMTRRNARR